jgi:hypothetical protein
MVYVHPRHNIPEVPLADEAVHGVVFAVNALYTITITPALTPNNHARLAVVRG